VGPSVDLEGCGNFTSTPVLDSRTIQQVACRYTAELTWHTIQIP